MLAKMAAFVLWTYVLSCPCFRIHWRNMELAVPRKGVLRSVHRPLTGVLTYE